MNKILLAQATQASPIYRQKDVWKESEKEVELTLLENSCSSSKQKMGFVAPFKYNSAKPFADSVDFVITSEHLERIKKRVYKSGKWEKGSGIHIGNDLVPKDKRQKVGVFATATGKIIHKGYLQKNHALGLGYALVIETYLGKDKNGTELSLYTIYGHLSDKAILQDRYLFHFNQFYTQESLDKLFKTMYLHVNPFELDPAFEKYSNNQKITFLNDIMQGQQNVDDMNIKVVLARQAANRNEKGDVLDSELESEIKVFQNLFNQLSDLKMEFGSADLNNQMDKTAADRRTYLKESICRLRREILKKLYPDHFPKNLDQLEVGQPVKQGDYLVDLALTGNTLVLHLHYMTFIGPPDLSVETQTNAPLKNLWHWTEHFIPASEYKNIVFKKMEGECLAQ